MSKAFFRFLRGELNGFYLTTINKAWIKYTQPIYEFLGTYKRMAFKISSAVSKEETPIPFEYLKGIGITAGVFPLFVSQDSVLESIHFTASKQLDGFEYSDRGLFRIEEENFEFVRTNQNPYNSDINTLADTERRTSLIEEEAVPLGYFPEGEEVLNDDGTVNLDKLLKEPPTDRAYVPYYGDKYLYLADKTPIIGKVKNTVYVDLIETMQWIRYNGFTTATMCYLAHKLCPDYLFILEMDWTKYKGACELTYGIDVAFEAEMKLTRQELFAITMKTKFPQVVLNLVPIEVTRDEEGKVIDVTRV